MQAELITVFLIGFFSSFGHCIGMCGGFVMAYSLKLNTGVDSQSITFGQSVYPHLLYNTGRILTYTFLGLLIGLVGDAMKTVLGIINFQGIIEVLAGLFMVVLGLEFGGWIPFNASKSVPGYQFFKNTISRMIGRVYGRLFTWSTIMFLAPDLLRLWNTSKK
jgi:sulfite exporter TauE/SafE